MQRIRQYIIGHPTVDITLTASVIVAVEYAIKVMAGI